MHELDPGLEWYEHIMHMLIFCKVHVQRNFQNKLGDHPAKDHLHRLWQATSRKEFLDMVDRIIHLYPDEKLKVGLSISVKIGSLLVYVLVDLEFPFNGGCLLLIILESVRVAIFRITTLLAASYPSLLQYSSMIYSLHMPDTY